MSDAVYVIWSFEHDAWWRPDGYGYTPRLDEAGRYDERTARDIISEANRYDPIPHEMAVILAAAERDAPHGYEIRSKPHQPD